MIHACIKNTSVPYVYVLLQRKTEDIYVELLSTLRSMLSELKLKTISIDFEQSMIQAIELVFVYINIQCCYYHLSQSIWRKVQNIGFATKYKENENVRQIVGMLKGLALLPLKYVKKVPRQDENQAENSSSHLAEQIVNDTDLNVQNKPPPPIFVKGVEDFPGLSATLIEIISVDNFFFKSSADKL
ncbi:hypothetical protein QTP88_002983 [Uroleucon formosanum]